ARTNDGITPNYTQTAIDRYALNDPYDRYYPSVDFREMALKNSMPFGRVSLSSSGGSDQIQYFAYLGYNGEGDIYKLGSIADYHRINTRSNVDIKINDVLKLKFDFFGNLTFRRSPNYGFDTDFTSEDAGSNPVLSLTEMPDFLGDITTIPPVAFPVWANYDEVSDVPWYGVSSAYGTNPIGGLEGQGYYTDNGRAGSANTALEYDMGNLIKGLTSKTFFGFNIFNLVRLGKAEDYIAYRATPSVNAATGNDTILLTRVHLGYDMADQNKLMDYYFQRFAFFQNFSYDRKFGKHEINSSLTYYISKTFKNGIEEPERQQNGIFTGTYTFDDKYSLTGVLNYAGTYSFAEDLRYRLFPSMGASWVISGENFMSNVKFIDFLKIRTQFGNLGNETFLSPFYYVDRWNVNTSGSAFGPISSGTWFGTGTDTNVPRSNIQRVGNPDLSWEVAKEFSAGIDALLFKQKLSLEVTYYNNVREGQIDQVEHVLPFMVGISNARPWYNYNDTRYYGLETALQLSDRVGKFLYSIGGMATWQNSERLKYDEPNYRFEYLSRVGKPVDAFFGQTYIGKFQTDAEALEVPQRFDDVLKAGDLKYVDMNNDGIVDDNDQSMIGHTTPRLFYSVNAKIGFANFELLVVGTGRAFYDIPLTNKYYWGGWGDDNYSSFVRDNIGGDYPRLTYYKVNNNFVNSTFWLADGGFFKIQNIELAYNLPTKYSKYVGARQVRFYLRGANLLTISDIKDLDPEALYTGVNFRNQANNADIPVTAGVTAYPLFKTFSGGVKFNF
nr:SusC/RagA family TonB-linked outer membrane protein [Bacteroidales bacterium]